MYICPPTRMINTYLHDSNIVNLRLIILQFTQITISYKFLTLKKTTIQNK